MAIDSNTYEGHTLKLQLMQVRELTKGRIKKTIVDRGYKIKRKIGFIDM
jgi:hypothetical protein